MVLVVSARIHSTLLISCTLVTSHRHARLIPELCELQLQLWHLNKSRGALNVIRLRVAADASLDVAGLRIKAGTEPTIPAVGDVVSARAEANMMSTARLVRASWAGPPMQVALRGMLRIIMRVAKMQRRLHSWQSTML
mmetsp:Transcript_21993/g.62460  ORF Transcript_21993/g.62460 Transcript_21993/m.62460 type:complete len:138 (+) Transcript_21993:133-546(+)